jgi:hypothetical protein
MKNILILINRIRNKSKIRAGTELILSTVSSGTDDFYNKSKSGSVFLYNLSIRLTTGIGFTIRARILNQASSTGLLISKLTSIFEALTSFKTGRNKKHQTLYIGACLENLPKPFPQLIQCWV